MARIWGKDPEKRGGAGYRADPEIDDDKGPLTCGSCRGSGNEVKETVRYDSDDEPFTEYVERKCSTCGGKGKVGH